MSNEREISRAKEAKYLLCLTGYAATKNEIKFSVVQFSTVNFIRCYLQHTNINQLSPLMHIEEYIPPTQMRKTKQD